MISKAKKWVIMIDKPIESITRKICGHHRERLGLGNPHDGGTPQCIVDRGVQKANTYSQMLAAPLRKRSKNIVSEVTELMFDALSLRSIPIAQF